MHAQTPCTATVSFYARLSNGRSRPRQRDGQVYTWGRGNRGQLGHGRPRNDEAVSRLVRPRPYADAPRRSGVRLLLARSLAPPPPSLPPPLTPPAGLPPSQVEALIGTRVSRLAAGDAHCAVLSGEGACYAWGAALSAVGRGPPLDADVPRPLGGATRVPAMKAALRRLVCVVPLIRVAPPSRGWRAGGRCALRFVVLQAVF